MRLLVLPVVVLTGLVGLACAPEEEEDDGRRPGREGEGEGEGEGEDCTAISLSNAAGEQLAEGAAAYVASVSPTLGGSSEDSASIEFFGDAPFSPGTIDLGAGRNINYSSCDACVLVFQDADSETAARAFFQTSGSMGLSADPLAGTLSATLTNVKLIEVTIDETEFVSTAVANGACLTIASASLEATITATPAP